MTDETPYLFNDVDPAVLAATGQELQTWQNRLDQLKKEKKEAYKGSVIEEFDVDIKEAKAQIEKYHGDLKEMALTIGEKKDDNGTN